MRSALIVLVGAAAVAAASAACSGSLPGGDALGVGFDVVTGASFSAPVVSLSQDNGGSWHDPYTGQDYCVSNHLSVLPMPELTVSSATYASASEVAAAKASDLGLDLGISILGLSPEIQHAKSYLNGGTSLYAELNSDFTMFEAGLASPPSQVPLSPAFQSAVAALPASYSPQPYAEFVAEFGTHVVVSGRVGGRVTMRGSVATSFTSVQASSSVALNAELQFQTARGNVVDGTVFSRASASGGFTTASEGTWVVTYTGGDPAIGSGGNLSAWRPWMESVKKLPVRISARLANVTEFVHDATTRDNLQRYIDSYLSANSDIGGPVVPAPAQLPLGPCDCTVAPENHACDDSYYSVALDLHDNEYPKSHNMVCCTFCDRYTPAATYGFPAAFGPVEKDPVQAELSLLPEAVPIAPINASGEACPVSSSAGGLASLCASGVAALGSTVNALTGRPASFRVVDFSYVTGASWANPYTGETVSLPDGVSASRSSSQGATVKGDSFLSTTDFSTALALDFGFQTDPAWAASNGAFLSLHDKVKAASQVFAGGRGAVGVARGAITLYQLQLPAVYQLNTTTGFQAAVDQLPTDYDADAYEQFLLRYGTHVTIGAVLGGRAGIYSSIDQQWYAEHDQSSMTGSVLGTYDWFRFGAAWNESHTQAFLDFQSSSASRLHLEGGDFDSASIAGDLYKSWVDSLPSNPVPLTTETARISEFVFDTAKAAALDKALDALLAARAAASPVLVKAGTQFASVFDADPKHNRDHCYLHHAGIRGWKENYSGFYTNNERCALPGWTGNDPSTVPSDRSALYRGPISFVDQAEVPVGGACPPGSFLVGFTGVDDGTFSVRDKAPLLCARLGYNATVRAANATTLH